MKSTRPKTTLNINGIFKQNAPEEKNVEVVASEKPQLEAIQSVRLKEIWEEYAEQRKDQIAEYQLLKREFTFKHPIITILLANPVEETLLENFRRDLIQFLRDRLKNSELTIDSKLKEPEGKKIIYTSKEKFEHLAEKNPYLNELKDRLGLDWDY